MDLYTIHNVINDNTRRKLIIDYVTSHQGCTKEEIDKHKDEIPISRQKLYDLIKELIEEGTLIIVRERINSRNHNLHTVRDSIFITIPREFEEIKDTYKRMLQSFIAKINGKPTPSNKIVLTWDYLRYTY